MTGRKKPADPPRVKIIVPLTGNSAPAVSAQLEKLSRLDVEVVEWRADRFYHPSFFRTIRRLCPEKELLFTVRSRREGGCFDGTKEELREMLEIAAQEGHAELIDLELRGPWAAEPAFLDQLRQAGARIVLSFHDFSATPSEEELLRLFDAMQEAGADVAKVAVMPREEADVETLIRAARRAFGSWARLPASAAGFPERLDPMRREDESVRGVPEILAISMGKLGQRTRISPSLTGSQMTFAALEEASAPGQIPAAELRWLLDRQTSGTDQEGGQQAAAAGIIDGIPGFYCPSQRDKV